jgi:hypothetical protein
MNGLYLNQLFEFSPQQKQALGVNKAEFLAIAFNQRNSNS